MPNRKPVPSEPTQPWERLPGEPDKAWLAFRIFRDIGPKRSYDETARRYYAPNEAAGEEHSGRKKSRAGSSIKRWAHQWSWNERAAAFDAYLDREEIAAQIEERREMARRHVKQAKALQFKAIERLAKMDPDELGPQDVLRYLVEATKLERLALGEPTERVEEEHKGGGDVTIQAAQVLVPVIKGATFEELEAMREHVLRIRNRTGAGAGEAGGEANALGGIGHEHLDPCAPDSCESDRDPDD
jgi:hypothetical protein